MHVDTKMMRVRSSECDSMFNHWTHVRSYVTQSLANSVAKELDTFFLIVAQEKACISMKHTEMGKWKFGPGYFTFDAKLRCLDSIALKSDQDLFYLLGA